MAVSYLLLGSNLGNRTKNLNEALFHLEKNNCPITNKSSVFESEPWGYTDSKWYYNLAVEVLTKLNPQELMEVCLEIEIKLGRKRNSTTYEARLIDIDILFYNDIIINSNSLQIPHPRIQNRRFVLLPLLEICQNLVHPILNKNISELLELCEDKGIVNKIKNLP
jgi:2-amino-4-hydroxy-6-hydroxymethyldihydropteridine diphosphokinase